MDDPKGRYEASIHAADRRERYEALIRMAMGSGPEFIHSLWKDYFDHSAAGVSVGASRELAILQHIRNYPPTALTEAEERFPMAELVGNFTIPAGFIRRRGVLTRLFSPAVAVELRKSNSLTKIKLSRPSTTDMRFPWQLALAANEYLKRSEGTPLSSRYVRLRGFTAYEMCYEAPHAVSLDRLLEPQHPDFLAQLQRAEVGLICTPGTIVRALVETRSLEEDKSSFDQFVQSLS